MKLSILAAIMIIQSCTTVGFHKKKILHATDFGPETEIRFCIYHEKKITDRKIEKLFIHWNRELALYRIRAVVVRKTLWQRPGWTSGDIMNDLNGLKLEPECDRMLALVNSKLTDVFYEVATIFAALFFLPLPEVLGAVDGGTHTRGFILADNMLLGTLFTGGYKHILTHEGYHMFGCGHSLSLGNCYTQIRKAKKFYGYNQEKGVDFFPGFNERYGFIESREKVNQYFGIQTER